MLKFRGLYNIFLKPFSTSCSATRNPSLCSIVTKGKIENRNCDNVVMNETKSPESSCPGKVFKVTPETFDSLAQLAADTLRSGGVIAIPTDTIYGIAADAQNNEAIRRIYEIKGRDCEKPISICLNRRPDFYKWANVQVNPNILRDLLPGPLTLVFERSPTLNPNLNPQTNLIGIRYPDSPFVDCLLTHFGGPVALTSANPSSAPSTLSPEEFRELWPFLDSVFDAGRIPILDSNLNPDTTDGDESTARLGSSVIDVSEIGSFRIIRKGISCDRYVEELSQTFKLTQKFD